MNWGQILTLGMLFTAITSIVATPVSAGKKDPAAICKDKKFKAAGKKAANLLKALGRNEKKPDGAKLTSDLSKAQSIMSKSFAKADGAGGCPLTDDAVAAEAAVDACVEGVAGLIGGGAGCGNGVLEGSEQCDAPDFGGTDCTSLGFTLGGTLGCTAECRYELSGCASQAVPSTGQTTCWDSAGAVISCTGTGEDGEIRAGAALSYVDNGDGTVTDLNTGLMWEKKSDDGSIHDKDNIYTWQNAFAVHVATLNAGSGFAGYTDWRMPNVKELQTLLDYEVFSPTIDPAFDNGCVSGCDGIACSCTGISFYWSSTTLASTPAAAWFVRFATGSADGGFKTSVLLVRAVRGGL